MPLGRHRRFSCSPDYHLSSRRSRIRRVCRVGPLSPSKCVCANPNRMGPIRRRMCIMTSYPKPVFFLMIGTVANERLDRWIERMH